MPEWLQIVLRSILFVILLFSMTKMLGKKQISELSFFEYVTGITIGSISAEISTGLETNIFHGIYSLLVWTIIPLGFGFLAIKSKTVRDFVEGKATVFIKDGKILEDNLKKEMYTIDELLTQLRSKNIFKVADVEFALLEPTGDLNILLKKEMQPLTPKDLRMVVANESEPQTVIMDGTILDAPLGETGLNRAWLHNELSKAEVTLDNVFYGEIDAYGQFTYDLYDDKIQVAEPQEKALLFAEIKKCQADLELFSLQTDNTTVKEMYHTLATNLSTLQKKVEPYLM